MVGILTHSMSTKIERRLRAAGSRVLALAATMIVASALSQAQTHVTSVFTGPYVETLANEGGNCVSVTPTVRQTNANGLSLKPSIEVASLRMSCKELES